MVVRIVVVRNIIPSLFTLLRGVLVIPYSRSGSSIVKTNGRHTFRATPVKCKHGRSDRRIRSNAICVHRRTTRHSGNRQRSNPPRSSRRQDSLTSLTHRSQQPDKLPPSNLHHSLTKAATNHAKMARVGRTRRILTRITDRHIVVSIWPAPCKGFSGGPCHECSRPISSIPDRCPATA